MRASRDFIAKCRQHDIPCDSFHFGSGYTSIGPRRYAFNWNREKFPDPAATMARLKEAGMQPVTNLKPCLLDDHPRLAEALDEGILRQGRRDGRAGRRAVLGRARLPRRLHQSRRPRLVAERHRDGAARLWRRLGLERQQRVRDLGRGRRLRTATAAPSRKSSRGRRSRC